MSRNLFGTDGIRGLAGASPLRAEDVLALGRALARTISQGCSRPKVVVAKDTRWSGDMLEAAFCAGVCSVGADVLLAGVLPTPAVAFLTQALGAQAGAMLSASHNPFADNGIKLFGPDGFKLSDQQELQIEAILKGEQDASSVVTGTALGRCIQHEPAKTSYLEHLKRVIAPGHPLNGIKVVLDAANGAASWLGPELFNDLGAEVIPLGNQPDGQNINARCGAMHPQALMHAVLTQHAQLGIALDGDADRLILVDEKGQLRNGDDCLALLAQSLLERGKLPGRTVVATHMSNLGLERFLNGLGLGLIRTQVGDRYVVEAMRAGGFALGGEQSGHLILLEHSTTGDGLLAALMVLSEMLEKNEPLSRLLSGLETYPQILLNVRFKVRRPLESLEDVSTCIQDVQAQLGDAGRVLVRFSGTEPLARVMIEGRDEGVIGMMAERIAQTLERALC